MEVTATFPGRRNTADTDVLRTGRRISWSWLLLTCIPPLPHPPS